ncbi:MAG: hypothetical protein V1867_04255 [Candidatus Falkowbacteria bacterium]
MSENGDQEKLRQILEKTKKHPLDKWRWEGGRSTLISAQAGIILVEIFIDYKAMCWPIILRVSNAAREALFEYKVNNYYGLQRDGLVDQKDHELYKFYERILAELKMRVLAAALETSRQAEQNKKQQLEDFLKE